MNVWPFGVLPLHQAVILITTCASLHTMTSYTKKKANAFGWPKSNKRRLCRRRETVLVREFHGDAIAVLACRWSAMAINENGCSRPCGACRGNLRAQQLLLELGGGGVKSVLSAAGRENLPFLLAACDEPKTDEGSRHAVASKRRAWQSDAYAIQPSPRFNDFFFRISPSLDCLSTSIPWQGKPCQSCVAGG